MLLKLDLSKYLYLFFIVLMLFTNLLKPIIVSVILIIYFVFRIWRYKKFSFNQILIYLIFESVPLSFFFDTRLYDRHFPNFLVSFINYTSFFLYYYFQQN